MTDTSLRIGFAGTPEFAASHLQFLLDQGFNIVAVYTQPDRPAGRGKKILPTPVKAVAVDHGVPVYQPETLNSSEAETELAALGLDVLVVVAYGLILNRRILRTPRLGCVNVHASLLPRWRGAAPVERAILAGDHETGVSIMQIDEGLDTGDILLRLPTPIGPDDNAQTVTARLLQLGGEGLARVLADLPAFQDMAEQQNDSQATYAKKLCKEESLIDWNKPAREIQHQVQALFPRSPAFSWYHNERIRIIEALAIPSEGSASPGAIQEVTAGSIKVACSSSSLRITKIQLPGKTPATLADIFNGHPGLFQPGTAFSALNPANEEKK